jgi:hypothetical protein
MNNGVLEEIEETPGHIHLVSDLSSGVNIDTAYVQTKEIKQSLMGERYECTEDL